MKKLLAFSFLLFNACSVIPDGANFSTSDWANRQDSVLAGILPADTVRTFDELTMLQELLGPTNLTVRQAAIEGDPAWAWDEFAYLCPGVTCEEGPAYYQYMKKALAWEGDVPPFMAAYDTAYARLVAPDSTLPLPENRGGAYGIPPLSAGESDVGPYRVMRQGSSYLLVFLDTNEVNYTYNLHVKPAFGAYVFLHAGTWSPAPYWYNGFSYQEVLTETTRWNTPTSVFEPDWRIDPPRISLIERDSSRVVCAYKKPRWFFGIFPGRTVTRTFDFSSSGFTVKDDSATVGAYSW